MRTKVDRQGRPGWPELESRDKNETKQNENKNKHLPPNPPPPISMHCGQGLWIELDPYPPEKAASWDSPLQR